MYLELDYSIFNTAVLLLKVTRRCDIVNDRQIEGRRRLMIGFQSLPREMQNGGIQLSTMLRPWLELVSSVFHMQWQILDGMCLRRHHREIA